MNPLAAVPEDWFPHGSQAIAAPPGTFCLEHAVGGVRRSLLAPFGGKQALSVVYVAFCRVEHAASPREHMLSRW